MVMLFLWPESCQDPGYSHRIRIIKQAGRTGVLWSFCLPMRRAEERIVQFPGTCGTKKQHVPGKHADEHAELIIKKGKTMNQNQENNIIIQAKELSKTYRRFKKKEGIRGSIAGLFKREYEEKAAVSHMDLQVCEGEFIGLIGPNGAGKTTLIKMLTGIIVPTSGDLSVLGFTPGERRDAFKKQYAVVMGQKSQLFFELTVNDILRLFQAIYEIPEQEFQENRRYFVELFQVGELMDVQVRTMSLGERMKMELMVALLHNPRVLFLDEPTIGLDAIASRQIRCFLQEVNREKHTTILLTSHYVEDIRTLCDRAVVVSHGRKFYDGSTAELFDRYRLREDEDMGVVMERIYRDGDTAWQQETAEKDQNSRKAGQSMLESGKEGYSDGNNF